MRVASSLSLNAFLFPKSAPDFTYESIKSVPWQKQQFCCLQSLNPEPHDWPSSLLTTRPPCHSVTCMQHHPQKINNSSARKNHRNYVTISIQYDKTDMNFFGIHCGVLTFSRTSPVLGGATSTVSMDSGFLASQATAARH